jgi:hypothetical protein
MRACALPPRILSATSIGESQPCQFLVLATEELFAGKLKAMIDRHHPRDLYDLYRFSAAGLQHDADLLRKFAVLFASTMDHDLRTYHMDRFKALHQKELERLLYPLLRADDRPTAEEMLKTVSPLRNRNRPYARSRLPRRDSFRPLPAGTLISQAIGDRRTHSSASRSSLEDEQRRRAFVQVEKTPLNISHGNKFPSSVRQIRPSAVFQTAALI